MYLPLRYIWADSKAILCRNNTGFEKRSTWAENSSLSFSLTIFLGLNFIISLPVLIIYLLGTFLVVQWLRFHVHKAADSGSILGKGTRSHMPQLRVHKLQWKTWCCQINEWVFSKIMYLLVLERSGHITKDEYIHTKDRSKQSQN